MSARPAIPYDELGRFPDASRPFLTHYDGPESRIELSVTSTANAVAKAAGMLRDSLGLGPGGTFSVDLPRHWQLPVWLMAGLSVGATCARRLPGDVDVRIVGPEGLAEPGRADELLACSCDAFGLPVPGGAPPGVTDVALEVRAHPDVFAAEPGTGAAARLVGEDGPVGWTEALDRSRAAGPAGARLWVDEATAERHLVALTCVVPLAVHGSVVLGTSLSAEQSARIRDLEGAVVVVP
jgi:uncharacterized protein (TIGR03089 family)